MLPPPACGWETASRDDGKVARDIHENRSVDRVYSLSEAVFFDELFEYIREIGAWPLLEDLDPQNRRARTYSFLQFVMFTIMRCVSGATSMLATQDLLLTDEALMGVLGFNARQVRDGSSGRGLSRRTEPVEIRGAFSYETVSDNIVLLGAEKLSAMFNGAIRCLAAQGIFPKMIDCVLDATDDEATGTYKTDDGLAVPSVTREKRPDVRANRHATKVKVTVFGWKLWLIWEPVSKVPLAMAMDGIPEADNKHALSVLQQAKKNVEGFARIRSVALDRGFLDGKLLSQIDDEKMLVYIPAKSNMLCTADAREIARRVEKLALASQPLPAGCVYRERHQTVKRGSGKNATEEIRTTTLVGISELACDWWTSEGSTSAANAKSFVPKKVHATVVLRWDGAPKDAEKEVVILTTDPADDPFVAFDAYDDRSLIENTCNREAKEAWFLEHHPKRSEAGVRVHAYFVFLCMALMAAYRLHKEKTDEAERRGKETGMTRYRRKLEVKNRDKVVVFIPGYFGIFRNFEIFLLMGGRIREHAGQTAETVLERYGAASVPLSAPS